MSRLLAEVVVWETVTLVPVALPVDVASTTTAAKPSVGSNPRQATTLTTRKRNHDRQRL
jgi:hypothetical protein